jgi:hypothetical protein
MRGKTFQSVVYSPTVSLGPYVVFRGSETFLKRMDHVAILTKPDMQIILVVRTEVVYRQNPHPQHNHHHLFIGNSLGPSCGVRSPLYSYSILPRSLVL